MIELHGRAGFAAMNAKAGNKSRLTVPDPDRFYFRIDHCDIGVIDVSRIQITAHRTARGTIEDGDHVNLFLYLKGGSQLESGRRRMQFGPGQIAAQVGWNRHEAIIDTFCDELLLRIDRTVLADRGVTIDPATLRFGPEKATTTTRALSAMVKSVVDAQSMTGEAVPSAIENAVLELVVGLHHEDLGYGGASNELDNGLHARATTVIGSRYRDPELTPSTLAAGLGVSVRQLQRAFEKAGSTPAAAIRVKRAGHATVLLRDPQLRRQSISEIAAAAGFASPGELRRAVRAEHGVTPSQMRR